MPEMPSANLTAPTRVPTEDCASGLRGLAASTARVPHTIVAAYVGSVRAAHPDATPTEVAYLLQRRYQFALGMGGVATGVTALRPMGTAAATGLSAAHLAGAAGLSSMYLLALCRVYGIDDPVSIQHLLAQCALGADNNTLTEYQLGLGPRSWYTATLARLPVSHVRWTRSIADRQLTKTARKRGVSRTAAGLPFGIGSGLGFLSGRLLAQNVIDAAHAHLGAPPAEFPALFPTPLPVRAVTDLDGTGTNGTIPDIVAPAPAGSIASQEN